MAREKRWRWWDLDEGDPDLASVLLACVQRVHGADSLRRAELQRAVRLYGPGLGTGRWAGGAARFGALSLNLVRVLAGSAVAALLQSAPPRPWYVTDGGDWELQEKAKGMTRLASAALYRCKFDAQARTDAKIAAALGTAVSKILERDGEPTVEQVMPWHLLVDPRDGHDGQPRSLYQLSWVDRDVLRARYLDGPLDDEGEGDDEAQAALRQAIDRAGLGGLDDDEFDDDDPDGTSDRVLVIEAWHLPSGPDAGDGRCLIATDKGVLYDGPWEEPSFPFAFLRWPGRITGFWSPGIADEIWPDQYEINQILERVRQMLHLVAVPRVWLEEGSKVAPGPLDNTIGAELFYRGAKPVFDVPRAVSPELWQLIEFIWSKSFQKLGISELSATAMKPTGLDSGKALRVYADQTSGRLAEWSLAWQDYYLQVSEQIVSLLRRQSRRGRGELTYLDHKSKRLERVRWADVAMQPGTYAVECYPVSSLPQTPSGRLQMLDEWLNAGLIDQDQYRRLVDLPDLGAETSLATAPRDALEAAVSACLRGEPESKIRRPNGSRDDLGLWLRLLPRHILRAELQGVPIDRIRRLEDLLVEAESQLAGAQGGGGGAPPAGPAGPAGGELPPGPEAGALPPEAMAGAMPPEGMPAETAPLMAA